MTRWVLGAVMLVGLVVAGLTTSVEPRSPLISETEERAVSLATMTCDTSLQATSSGVVISDGMVLTVAHAIYESREFAVRDFRGRWHDGIVEYMDLERDLALVSVPTIMATSVDSARAAVGDNVVLLEGAASGTADGEVLRRVRITTEVVGDLSRESVRSGYEVALEITGGDSGAGVFDDDGQLVGIVFARSTQRESVAWTTAISELDEIRDLRGVPTWDCGVGTGARLNLEDPEPPRLP